MKHFVSIMFLLVLGCSAPEHPKIIAIVGASLQNPGGGLMEHSVVIVEDGLIVAAGTQAMTPIPKDAEIIDGSGGEIKPFAMETIAPGKPADLTLIKGTRIRVMTKGAWEKGQ